MWGQANGEARGNPWLLGSLGFCQEWGWVRPYPVESEERKKKRKKEKKKKAWSNVRSLCMIVTATVEETYRGVRFPPNTSPLLFSLPLSRSQPSPFFFFFFPFSCFIPFTHNLVSFLFTVWTKVSLPISPFYNPFFFFFGNQLFKKNWRRLAAEVEKRRTKKKKKAKTRGGYFTLYVCKKYKDSKSKCLELVRERSFSFLLFPGIRHASSIPKKFFCWFLHAFF